MDTRFRHLLGCMLAWGLAFGLAPAYGATLFIVTEPWVRVAPNGRSAEAYMQLKSTGGAAVVGISSEFSPDVTMRPPGTAGGTVREIQLPAGVTLLLAPGAYRFVLAKLSRPLKLGDRVPFVLIVENPDGSRQEIAVNAEVRRRSPTDDHKIPHRHS